MSNALKFTDEEGQVEVSVELLKSYPIRNLEKEMPHLKESVVEFA